MKKKIIPALVVLILLGGSALFQGIVMPAAADTVNVKAKPGMTIYYEIEKLNYSKELLNSLLSTTNISIVPKSDLSGAELYVKVLNAHQEQIPVTDFATQQTVTTSGDIVDVEMGLLVKKDTTFEINGTDVVIPAGTGFNIPIIFGTITDFIIPSGNTTILPLPFFLSQDWLSHESTLKLFSDYVDVSNTAKFFNVSIALQNSQLINFNVNGDISWRKSDGLLVGLNLAAYNSTDDSLILDVSLKLEKTEFRSINLKTGEYYALILNKTETESTISDKTIKQLYDQLVGNLTAAQGSAIFAIKIGKVDGLYYEVKPLSLNMTSGELVEGNSTWLYAFGKYPQGLSLNVATMLAPNTTGISISGNAVRDQAILGPFTTPDWDIYRSWDASTSIMIQPLVDQLLVFLQQSGLTLSLGNLTIGAPNSMTVSTSGKSSVNESYYTSSTSLTVTQDLSSTNFTQTIGGYNVTPTTKFLLQTDLSLDQGYAIKDTKTPYLDYVKLTTTISLVISTEVNGYKLNATIADISITNLLKGNYASLEDINNAGAGNDTKALLSVLGILAGISTMGIAVAMLIRKGA